MFRNKLPQGHTGYVCGVRVNFLSIAAGPEKAAMMQHAAGNGKYARGAQSPPPLACIHILVSLLVRNRPVMCHQGNTAPAVVDIWP